MSILRFLHLAAFVFWYGTLLYFTFVSAPVLFKSLAREEFGLVQSKLFPSYYVIGYACGALLLLTYAILHPPSSWEAGDWVKAGALSLMLLFALGQGLWIGPKVGALRVERQEAERSKDEARATALRKEFGKAHGISSLFNLVVVVSGMVYLVCLSREFNS